MIVGLIPAYNESKTIFSVIEGLKFWVDKILVIDDGSQDETAYEAARSGVQVYSLDKNYGVGQALKAGFQICLKENYDHAILIDGDGAHNARDAKDLIQHHIENENDLTIGNRFLSPPTYVSTNKIIANRFAASLLNSVEKHDIGDVACGMRILSRKSMSLSFESNSYDMIYEMLIKAKRNNMKVGQFGVDVRYDGSTPLLTPIAELICLIDVSLSFCNDQIFKTKLLKFRQKVATKKPFKVTMSGFHWMKEYPQPLIVYGQPIKDYDSYLFQYSHPYWEQESNLDFDLSFL